MQIGVHMETPVGKVSTARVALSCHFALDLPCDNSDSCSFPEKCHLKLSDMMDMSWLEEKMQKWQ